MFEIDKAKFGGFVSALRKEKGYTQKDLAQRLYISDKAVSKWETGASIPDTALLVPLAELLGVTVTELLMCERIPEERPMQTGQVESIVKTAISYSDEKPARAYQAPGPWPVIYLCAAVLGGLGTALIALNGALRSSPFVCTILCLIFGGYFCFFVRTRLPRFYDENPCGLYYDGLVRLNVPGVAFNNRNWPHIIRAIRIWTCGMLGLYPLLLFALTALFPQLPPVVELPLFLVPLLGGLFLPVYVLGRKYR